MSEVIFLQLILFANAAFFCSLLGLVSRSVWEGNSDEEISTRMALLRKDQSLTPYLACLKKRWITDRLFMLIALSYIVSFMSIAPSQTVSWRFLFAWATSNSAVLSLTNKPSLCSFKLICWSRWLLNLGLINLCTYSCIRTAYTTFLIPCSSHILTYLVKVAFGPKSSFKNKCRARAGFELQNEAHLQLWRS